MTLAPDLCAPWIGTTEVRAIEKFKDLPDEKIAPLLMPASLLCYKLSGRHFPGLCTVTDLRPCVSPAVYAKLPHNLTELILWYGRCGCGGSPWSGSCVCTDYVYQLDLGPYSPTTVAQVSEVRVDGAAFDPTKWTISDFQYLQRLDGQSWPLIQRLDLPSTEVGTWAVDLEYGTPPPEDAQLACALFCGEMTLTLNPGSGVCGLPERVQSVVRQGVTYVITDPQQYIDAGRTGIPLIDMWLTATNPSGSRGKAQLSFPGKGGQPGRVRT